MPYTVFALKWRPQNFDEIVGQGHVANILKSALEKNRLAHAFLFAGPRGVGKTSTARILAKSLNCKQGPTVTPCQKCSCCLEISQGRSLDVIEIDGASNRGIDEIRALRENVKFAPVSGKFKIYIIDEVHMLTAEAFNALLKTLEEPPEFVKFIFATTQPNKVIPTIISRCQRFDFRHIPVMEIIRQLERIVSAEKIGIDKEVLFAIAKSSDGSLRDAESILDQLASFSGEKFSLQEAFSMLGLIEQEALFSITDAVIRKDAKDALRIFNDIVDAGKEPSVFLSNLIEHLRNLMVARVTQADAKLVDLPQEVCAKLLKQGQAFALEELFVAFNILLNAQEMSRRIESLRIPLEIALVRLAYEKKGHNPTSVNPPLPAKTAASRTLPASEIPRRPELKPPVKPLLQRSDVIPEQKAEPKPQDGNTLKAVDTLPAISLEQITEKWKVVIEQLGPIKMSVATYLSEGVLEKCEGNTVTVSFPKNYSLHKESLEGKENKALIERILSQIFNVHIRINLTLSQEVQAPAAKSKEMTGFVQSAIDMFGGRVVKEE